MRRELGAEPVIPHPSYVREPLIDLWLTKRFRVRGDPRLVGLYRLRMWVENLSWRGVAKVRMHVGICFTCIYAVAISAHKLGRLELANCIAAFTY